MPVLSHIPTNSGKQQGSSFSVFLPKLAIFCSFDTRHANGHEAIYHYGFDIHFS